VKKYLYKNLYIKLPVKNFTLFSLIGFPINRKESKMQRELIMDEKHIKARRRAKAWRIAHPEEARKRDHEKYVKRKLRKEYYR
jgi:hypothetical protein